MHKFLVHLPIYLLPNLFQIIITFLSCISINTIAHIYLLLISIEHNLSSTCPYKDTKNELKYWLCKFYLYVLTTVEYNTVQYATLEYSTVRL